MQLLEKRKSNYICMLKYNSLMYVTYMFETYIFIDVGRQSATRLIVLLLTWWSFFKLFSFIIKGL